MGAEGQALLCICILECPGQSGLTLFTKGSYLNRRREFKISQLTALELEHRLHISAFRALLLLALTFHIFSCSFSGFCRCLPPLPGSTRRWVLSVKHFLALCSSETSANLLCPQYLVTLL